MLRTQTGKVECMQNETDNVSKEMQILSKSSKRNEKNKKSTLMEMKNAFDVTYQ